MSLCEILMDRTGTWFDLGGADMQIYVNASLLGLINGYEVSSEPV